jgi:hypothetical protein
MSRDEIGRQLAFTVAGAGFGIAAGMTYIRSTFEGFGRVEIGDGMFAATVGATAGFLIGLVLRSEYNRGLLPRWLGKALVSGLLCASIGVPGGWVRASAAARTPVHFDETAGR